MTTPAVHKDRYTESHFDRSSTLQSYSGVTRNGRNFEERPASVSVPWSGGPHSWRSPTEWYHNSYSIKAANIAFSCGAREGRPPNTYLREASYNGPCTIGLPTQWESGISGLSNNLRNRSLTEAYSNISTNPNLGEFFATYKEAVRLVAGTAGNITRDVRAFRHSISRRDWYRLKRQFRCRGKGCSKSLSDAWLSLEYGWIPLLSDVYAILFELSDSLKDKGATINSRGAAFDTTMETQAGSIAAADWPNRAQFRMENSDFEVQWETRHKCFTSLWFELELPTLALASSLGLINPVSLAWELMRFSFVLDWLVPIGPWLDSFTADYGWKFLSGTQSYKREANVTGVTGSPSLVYYGSGTPLYQSIGSPNLEGRADYFTRKVYLTRPVPGIYYKNPLSAKHAISALALLVQAFSK